MSMCEIVKVEDAGLMSGAMAGVVAWVTAWAMVGSKLLRVWEGRRLGLWQGRRLGLVMAYSTKLYLPTPALVLKEIIENNSNNLSKP